MPSAWLGITLAIAEKTAFNPSSAEELEIIGTRACAEISPQAFTNPAATLVPPMSTPTKKTLSN
jgi:hypothetical protein